MNEHHTYITRTWHISMCSAESIAYLGSENMKNVMLIIRFDFIFSKWKLLAAIISQIKIVVAHWLIQYETLI